MLWKMKTLLLENGAVNALMSGSGPTVFAVFRDKQSAEAAKEKLAEANLVKQLFVTTFHNENENKD